MAESPKIYLMSAAFPHGAAEKITGHHTCPRVANEGKYKILIKRCDQRGGVVMQGRMGRKCPVWGVSHRRLISTEF